MTLIEWTDDDGDHCRVVLGETALELGHELTDRDLGVIDINSRSAVILDEENGRKLFHALQAHLAEHM